MAELKTKPTDNSVESYLNNITEENRRQDAMAIINLLKEVTESEPVMWGEKIVGFGDFHYKSASGREGDWFKAGFAVAKANITIYLMAHGLEKYEELFQRLGKHKTGKGCIYIKRMEDINPNVLKEIVKVVLKDISKFAIGI
jgi:hypothetical protein